MKIKYEKIVKEPCQVIQKVILLWFKILLTLSMHKSVPLYQWILLSRSSSFFPRLYDKLKQVGITQKHFLTHQICVRKTQTHGTFPKNRIRIYNSVHCWCTLYPKSISYLRFNNNKKCIKAKFGVIDAMNIFRFFSCICPALSGLSKLFTKYLIQYKSSLFCSRPFFSIQKV